jgi:uncharacterized membrane protein YhaH (DUF805 family)
METSILSFEGRITRSTYWLRLLIAYGLLFTLGIFSVAAGGAEAGAALTNAMSFAVSIFLFIQGVKRMHDVGSSGWCLLIPFYGFVLLLSDGTPGPNEYGADPKAMTARRGEVA